MRSRAVIWLSLLLFAGGVRAAQNNKNSPALALHDKLVVASQITPGGKALVFGMVRHPRRDWLEIDHVLHVVSDDSKTGSVTWTEKESIPPFAFFGVIDLESGAVAFAAPEGSGFHQVEFPGKGLHRGAAGQFERFEAGHELLDVIWVRPGVGAWSYYGADGGHDSDHRPDGRLSIDPGDMSPIAGSPDPPKQYLPGDTLVWIDPRTMEYATSEVPR